jgi:RNA polymerase sigma-70 factor (ECF subfamily)
MSVNGQSPAADWIHSAMERHEADLLRYAQRLTGNLELARDVVQETFLRLCRQDQQHIDGHLTKWLYTVCRNKALDVRRKENRMTSLVEPEKLEPQTNGQEPVAILTAQETAGTIIERLNGLPESQQEVIRLKFQNGLSYREIAEITDQKVSNVGYLIHQGMKSLRKQLKSIH